MTDLEIGFTPQLRFLSEVDKEKLHAAVLALIGETGMEVHHEEALKRLKDAGCRVKGEKRITIPAALVERCLKTVPEHIVIYDREGEPAMDLGGRRAYFGTGSDLMWGVAALPDGTGFKRHHTRLADIETAARVCDALPNIDFIMSFAHPHELDPAIAYLSSFKAMVANCRKPIVNTAQGRADLAAMWEIAKVLRGGERAYRDKPYWVQYAEPISPLRHVFDSVDKLLFCAETGSPVIYSPAPIAGSTAPMTIAGHLVQGIAESLFGMVIHQLTAEGAPFLMGVGAAVLDMATSQCAYNAPEYLMCYMGMVEMSHFYNIPNWGYAGTSDAQIPDGQATFEAGLEAAMATWIGSNLNHDVGYLDFGLSGSLEMVVIMDEIIDQLRRIQKGIPVDDDTLALDVIPKGHAAGQFLTQPHTMAHLRRVQWRPKLFNRQGYEQWDRAGRTSLLERARLKLEAILADHRPKGVALSKQAQIDALVAQFRDNCLAN